MQRSIQAHGCEVAAFRRMLVARIMSLVVKVWHWYGPPLIPAAKVTNVWSPPTTCRHWRCDVCGGGGGAGETVWAAAVPRMIYSGQLQIPVTMQEGFLHSKDSY